MNIKEILILLFLSAYISACQKEKSVVTVSDGPKTLFSLLPESQTKIDFINTVKQDIDFNYINYPYVYTGAGVAVGDINNDALPDIYFTSNQNENKLYLNKGDFEFEDITASAGVKDAEGWSTGVSMIDINNDGWMDIYVCKSASLKNDELRRNKLFINQKNGTFKEEAKKWGLDQNGFSIQAYFFDYDKDGDLDMYLVNHRPDFKNARIINSKDNPVLFEYSSDHLFRNDGHTFTDVSLQSKIANHAWGLSASIGDFNEDGWLDIYIANDYIQPDILYINNQDGTFSDKVLGQFKHISYNSMGSDYADINNDMLPDLIVLDMLAEDHQRGKENMPSMNTKGFWIMVNSDYHYRYMANVLQLNKGNGNFNDIGQLAGISKTDWSWAPLIADFDNDGFKDILITNGIERELGNQDYVKKAKQQAEKGPININELMNIMPSEKIANYIFRNNGDLTFENKTEEWGIYHKLNSNGVAYADLDNDGDLDFVLNNMSDKASIYKNNSNNNYINIKLIGEGNNIDAIGAKVKVITPEKSQYQEMFTARGYQSSISDVLNFGLGDEVEISRIEVTWPGKINAVSVLENVKANQTITIELINSSLSTISEKDKKSKDFKLVDPRDLGIDSTHKENDFNDFDLQVLLPQKQSTQGPALAIADINNDGLDDFFIGGAKGQPGAIYIQKSTGVFTSGSEGLLMTDKEYEDQGAIFFDADNDGDPDLYVTSGGYELAEESAFLQDRLYLNDGKGNYKKSSGLPKMLTSTKGLTTIDFDNDGDTDLLVGGRVIGGRYPLAPRSYLLRNDNGHFTDVTKEVVPEFFEIGLVNNFTITDYDNDGDPDFFVAGEWMPITLFENNGGSFTKGKFKAFENTSGWWNTIVATDFDKDGDDDYFVGNLGNNNKFHPSTEKPLHIYGNYFDDNKSYDMILSKHYKGKLVPVRGKECSSEQTPFLNEKFETYKEFASSSLEQIYGEDKLQEAYHLKAHTFSSIYIQNDGNGNFTLKNLPSNAQTGPTMAFEIFDINNDGHLDILGAGAIYEAEVETIRYDANTGYVLLGDGKGNFTSETGSGFYIDENTKNMKKIIIAGETHFIAANNDSEVTLLKLITHNSP